MIDDDIDKIVQELKAIRRNVGDRSTQLSQDIDVQTNVSNDPKSLNDSLLIHETSDMDGFDNGDAVTVGAGEKEDLVDYEAPANYTIQLLALGATDVQGLEYALFIDGDKQVTDWHESPFGSYLDPFSFVEKLDGYYTADRRVMYRARNVTQSDIDAVARVFLELK